jgi:hypothetical protein
VTLASGGSLFCIPIGRGNLPATIPLAPHGKHISPGASGYQDVAAGAPHVTDRRGVCVASPHQVKPPAYFYCPWRFGWGMARAASQQSSILMFVSKSSARIGETPKLRYFISYVASIERNFVISS